ncbi:uncharacterized protein EV422DRAFT_518764 [Fimicolochytrium jonesii]|uniref:uncharacterized protein n=1 Tax=Fimicolochytrium jonesii TaxID=1396493 RepID=UPI0022FDF266|nr:uncharacterized protein EV422DRAFT_518764 [Fimicolochytrium jonesii]KAI8824059.1 hypothetical protein EV422DRAFT_518764 [Fimicolochytrium jonesii]
MPPVSASPESATPADDSTSFTYSPPGVSPIVSDSPNLPTSTSTASTIRSFNTYWVLIPVAIFVLFLIIALLYKYSPGFREAFNRPKVTSSKPVEIVYREVEHDELLITRVDSPRPLSMAEGVAELERERDNTIVREMRRYPTLESLATVYMAEPPSYAASELDSPRPH